MQIVAPQVIALRSTGLSNSWYFLKYSVKYLENQVPN